MKQYKIDELNQLHTDSKSLDREAVAEFRSNILLIAGEHYSKRMTDRAQSRGTTSAQVNQAYQLRITKNLLHRAHRVYVTSILSQSPSAAVTPRTSNCSSVAC